MSLRCSARRLVRAAETRCGHTLRGHPAIRAIFADIRTRVSPQDTLVARAHAELHEAVQAQAVLHLRYGIGAGNGGERAKIRKTGARVGLQVPDFADEVEARLKQEAQRAQSGGKDQ